MNVHTARFFIRLIPVLAGVAYAVSVSQLNYAKPTLIAPVKKVVLRSIRTTPVVVKSVKDTLPIEVATPSAKKRRRPPTIEPPDALTNSVVPADVNTEFLMGGLSTFQPPAAFTQTPPPSPPDDYLPQIVYEDKDGGPVLVLGILVDSTGTVKDVKILVKSSDELGNLTYALAALKQRVLEVTPPIPPGEERWLEKRIRFVAELPTKQLLP